MVSIPNSCVISSLANSSPGQSGDPKNTAINSFPNLEGFSPGDPNSGSGWNDLVLTRLDDFMNNAKGYGIKLLISFYSYNALQGNEDFYGKWYGTGDFYTDANAIQYYKNRVAHVMNHVNPHNGKSWANSPEYIFAFETQNEAMHDNENPDALVKWQCDIAGAIKSNMGGRTDILVATGGGSYVDTSLQAGYFSCANLDVLSIHAYGAGDLTTSKLSPYVTKATQSGKKLIMQEWGSCYFDSSNNRCSQTNPLASGTRDNNIKGYADAISKAGIPWMYWQILPNEDPHQDWDYEVGINGANWDALKSAALAASGYSSPFDFSKWLP